MRKLNIYYSSITMRNKCSQMQQNHEIGSPWSEFKECFSLSFFVKGFPILQKHVSKIFTKNQAI